MYPKIELLLNLEATVAPETLLAISGRNHCLLPATAAEDLRELYRYRDFDHFMAVWTVTTNDRTALGRRRLGQNLRWVLRRSSGGDRSPRCGGASDADVTPGCRPRRP